MYSKGIGYIFRHVLKESEVGLLDYFVATESPLFAAFFAKVAKIAKNGDSVVTKVAKSGDKVIK